MYEIHDVVWDSKTVNNFWNGISILKPNDDNFFSSQVGKRLVNYVSNGDTVLDYGCGQGHMIQQILENRNAKVFGFDISSESTAIVNKRFKNHKGFEGARSFNGFPIPFSDAMFDVVFLLETVEHVDDEILVQVVHEIHRVLKPGGKVIVTTPNNENLEKSFVICPECGCTFHSIQHLRTWDKDSIHMYFTSHQFKTVQVKETRLHHKFPIWFMDIGTKITGKKRLNLIYVGKK